MSSKLKGLEGYKLITRYNIVIRTTIYIYIERLTNL
jgi:hypothetical protein